MKRQQRISSLITMDQIRNWNKGQVVTISAPTGSGKSHFIKNILYLIAKERNQKILFLVHRKRCKQQFYNELDRDKKLDTIDIVTYQTLEKNKKNFDLSKYEYIVCDEFHYFTSDSNFNYKTDISLEKILGQTDKIRIFMSATGDLMTKYIKNIRCIETIEYTIEQDFSWMKLNFFNKKSTINVILDEVIERNEKAIVFIDNVERCYELYKEYKANSLFCCSENNRYYNYVDNEAINYMLEKEKFSENLLITTNVLDAGVNIKDDEIKTIICSIKDVGVLVQCLGRKRRKNNEKVNVYIENFNNQCFGREKSETIKALEMARDLDKIDINEWTDKYSKKDNKLYGTLVYDEGNEKKVNELMKFKLLERNLELFLMTGDKEKKIEGIGYKKYLASKFNTEYETLETYYEEIELEEYLDNITGKKLFKEEQKELKDKIGLIDSRGRKQTSIGQLNAYLIKNYNKTIINGGRPRVNGKQQTVWIVSDL
ncbi:DEAD/DEAH box helicase family protein [Clostridium perfringens]|nr:DEAD/DEAH box helicase family protein [Clostridium perfringens]